MSEEWRAVAGFEGIYEVSSEGRVRSLARMIPHRRYGQRKMPAMLRKPYRLHGGHLGIDLCKDGVHTKASVHRLVAFAFLGPGGPGLEVCHNDGVPTNNHVGNLRWDTSSANKADAVRHGAHWNTAKTQCKWGHDFSPENTYRRPSNPNRRDCRQCTRIRDEKARGATNG